jgi:hypothetical protein
MPLCSPTTSYLGFKFQCLNKTIYVTFYHLHSLKLENRTAQTIYNKLIRLHHELAA